MWQPLVGLYCAFGFCWQRTWDRPFVPDIEAVPAADREYYERHGCFQHNNPGLNRSRQGCALRPHHRRLPGPRWPPTWTTTSSPAFARSSRSLDGFAQEARAAKPSAGVQPTCVTASAPTCTGSPASAAVCAWCENVYGYLDAQGRSHVEDAF